MAVLILIVISVKRSVLKGPTNVYKPNIESSSSNDILFEDQQEDVSRIPSATVYEPTIPPSNSIKIWKKLGFKLVLLAIIVRIIHIFKLGYLFGEVRLITFTHLS